MRCHDDMMMTCPCEMMALFLSPAAKAKIYGCACTVCLAYVHHDTVSPLRIATHVAYDISLPTTMVWGIMHDHGGSSSGGKSGCLATRRFLVRSPGSA